MLNRLVDWVTNLIGDHGVPAVFFLMILESACLPVPSEVIMLFAGYLVSIHSMSLTGAVAAGVAGNIVGSWIAWGVGMSGGRVLLERHGRYVHITPERLDMADRWFERRGERIVLIARCLPIIRTFISLPAGIARMPFWRFTLYTAIGCVPWVLALTLLGVQVGSKWDEWHKRLEFLDYLVAAAHRRRHRLPGRAPEARHRARMREGLPGEERLLRWAHRHALRVAPAPAPARARDRRPLRRRRARLRPARRCSRCGGPRTAAPRCAPWRPASWRGS